MKQRRSRELLAASRFLGISRTVILNIPDGKVNAHRAMLLRQAKAYTKRFQPDVIMGFGKDGVTGHRDHSAASQTVNAVARALRLPAVRFCLSPTLQKDERVWKGTRRTKAHFQKEIHFAQPTVRIVVNSSLKRHALSLHRSQMEGKKVLASFPAAAVREILRAEYFSFS